MGGGGGYAGSVQNQFESTVYEGYATVGTDAGHTGFALLAGWALRNDRRIADYGHRAVHRTAEVTRALIVAYYSRPPEHSYFIGCSNGGREALMGRSAIPPTSTASWRSHRGSTLSSGLRRSSATCMPSTQQATSAHLP